MWRRVRIEWFLLWRRLTGALAGSEQAPGENYPSFPGRSLKARLRVLRSASR